MDLNLPDVLNFCARRRINFPSNPRAPDSKGVSDALRRRYLKKLTFFISECEDSDSCIELYTFSFEVREQGKSGASSRASSGADL